MARRTKQGKNKLRYNLDLQQNIYAEIAARNPKIIALQKKFKWPLSKNDEENYFREFNKICCEVYGEELPSVFPVWSGNEPGQQLSRVVVSVDLKYSKEEIMYVLEKFITSALSDYRKQSSSTILRKHPPKWIEYLEIWDLRRGDPFWVPVGKTKLPVSESANIGRAWTYEEIAKHFYPDKQTPAELVQAIDKVKKQFRAAYKLICGEKYDPKIIREKISASRLGANHCDNCSDKECMRTGEVCSLVLIDLKNIEVKQQHPLIGDLKTTDLEQYKRRGKKTMQSED